MKDFPLPASDCFGWAGANIPAAVGPSVELSGTSVPRDQRRLAIVREAIRDGRPLHHLEEWFDWLDNVADEPSC